MNRARGADGKHRRQRVAPGAGAAMVAVLAFALGACQSGGAGQGSPTPLTIADAPTHYESALEDVRVAITGAAGQGDWFALPVEAALPEAPGGQCAYRSELWRSSLDLTKVDAWPQVVEAINPVLAANGFATTTGPESNSSGWTQVRVKDANGATLTLRTKEHTELVITGAVVDDGQGPCPAGVRPSR